MLAVACGGDDAKKTNSPDAANNPTRKVQATPVSNNNSSNAATAAGSDVTFSEEEKGTPTTLKGKVSGLAAGKKIYVERKEFESNETIKVVELGADGTFECTIGVEKAGIYRMRMGLAPVYMVLNGGENVEFDIAIEKNKLKSCTVTGSEETAKLQGLIGKDEKAIAAAIKNSSNKDVLVNLTVVERLSIQVYINAYRKVRDQLAAVHPNWSYTKAFGVKVGQVEAALAAAGAGIKVGDKAPDIKLKDPSGKEYKLSDLKGKVVLIDFWASWCGPCRRENPNVVNVYKKYKDKGFTVFSVSLDGLDDRTMMMLNNDPQRLTQAKDQQKQRWQQAIKADGLEWPYHVSELRKWSSSVAKTYQVNSIPKAFLIDRKGKVRFSNPSQLRGPALEQSVKSLL